MPDSLHAILSACVQVFVLGRLNRAPEALRLIVQDLRDVPRAIAFASAQVRSLHHNLTS
jgi:hypothetical protein